MPPRPPAGPRARLALDELPDRRLPAGGVPTPDHVVVLVLENHGFGRIAGSPDAPYLNGLAAGPHASLLTNSFAVEHPSQPNYLDLFSGANQGVAGDAVPAARLTAPNLGAALLAAGRTFAGYSEGLPAAGSLAAAAGDYARKHNPWSDWQGEGANALPAGVNLPFDAFPADYAALPTVAFVVPDQRHDMHDGTVAEGDRWARDQLGGYAEWAKAHNSLLIVTFDEDDFAGDNRIFTLFVGRQVRGGEDDGRVDHFGVLRTLEDMYGLPYAGASAAAAPVAGVWASHPGPPAFAAGPDAGGAGPVALFRGDGSAAGTLDPFPGFVGGVRPVIADFNGDGTADLAAGTGPGVGNRVVVVDGRTRQTLASFSPYEPAFTGGVFLAAGDVTGDGVADLVVTPDRTGGPVVAAYDGAVLASGTVRPVGRFLGIDDPNFRGGARSALADMNGDGFADLIVAAGFGGGPRVAIYDGRSVAAGTPTHLVPDFYVFEAGLRNGAFVAAGDVTGDGRADLVFGGGPGGAPRVKVLDGAVLLAAGDLTDGDGRPGLTVSNFFGGDPGHRGGVRVAVKDLDGDARADLVVGAGDGAGSRVTGYSASTLAAGTPVELFGFDAFPGDDAGVYVG